MFYPIPKHLQNLALPKSQVLKVFGYIAIFTWCHFLSSEIVQELPEKKVVYTCICGDYDTLKVHSYVRPDWDYICFTNNMQLLKQGHQLWEIRPLKFASLDPTRNNRWHKLFPNKILNDYDKSLYVDANVDIKSPALFEYIDSNLAHTTLAVNKHYERCCLYQEAETCKILHKDDPDIIDLQMSILRELNYPENNGLTENNMIYRDHHDEEVVKIMEEWWYWISHYSKRDQLSFNYVIWRRGFKLHIFAEMFARDPLYGSVVDHTIINKPPYRINLLRKQSF